MSQEPSSVLIPNLIQGVSQQAPAQRRDTQCEAQFNCINSPVEGCVARPSTKVLKIISGIDWRNRFFYDIRRRKDEHYLVCLGGAASPSVLDLADGATCSLTITDVGSVAYLSSLGFGKDALVAATVNDYTFVANRERVVGMAPDLSPLRPSEAIFHFRAGGYSTTYAIALILGGVRYTWTYKTPDNSVAGNADYISTNQLAATFYRAMTGTAAPVPSSGIAGEGTGAVTPGDTGYYGPTTATSLGFSVDINGNTLRVWRNDGSAFGVSSSDGLGDAHLKALRGTAPAFADLPSRCFDGVVIKVKGSNRTEKDDYYVRFRASGSGGYWEETLSPNTKYKLDAHTMPQALINTGYRTFTLGPVPWGNRVVGDAESSQDPSFVGDVILDLAFDNGRLALLREGGVVWSKDKDPFVFFKDTVQTKLASAPVDYDVGGTREVALLRRIVHKAGTTQIWAEQRQFNVTVGDQGFAEGNVEIKPSTSYEFAERCPPVGVGNSLIFATEVEDVDADDLSGFATLRDIYVVGDVRTPPQETDITAHVPKYVPAGVRWIAASDTLNLLVAVSDYTPSRLYLYNWLISENNRVQSAWNIWELPDGCSVLWAGIYRGYLKVLAQCGTQVLLLATNLRPNQVDKGVTGAMYATRLDLMVTDAQITRSYNPTTNRTTITLPYAAPDPTAQKFVVVVKDDVALAGGGEGRGFIFETVSVSGYQVVVKGNCTGHALYLGYRIRSTRTESEFFLRSEQGVQPVERLQVLHYDVSFAATGYFRAEVTYDTGKVSTVNYAGRILGDPENVSGVPIARHGTLRVPIQSISSGYSLTLVNDSPFPSCWTSAKVYYTAASQGAPTAALRRAA